MIKYFDKDDKQFFVLDECENSLLTIQKNVEEISDKVYSIEIEKGVQRIPDYAFIGCVNLQDVYLPGTVRTIGDFAFYNCENLNIHSEYNMTFPQALTKIGNYAFCNTKIKNVNLSGCPINSIGYHAFDSCLELETVILPYVEEISFSTFSHCHKLTKIVIQNTTKKIGSDAFGCCDNLENIELPDSVEKINSGAFSGCSKLKEITLPKNITCIDEFMFSGCKLLKTIYFYNIKEIKRYAFKNCESLNYLYDLTNEKKFNNNLLNNVEFIDDSAFANCKKLTILSLPNIKKIGSASFKNCCNLTLTINKNAILLLYVNHCYCIKKSIHELEQEKNFIYNLYSILIPHISPLTTNTDMSYNISFY